MNHWSQLALAHSGSASPARRIDASACAGHAEQRKAAPDGLPALGSVAAGFAFARSGRTCCGGSTGAEAGLALAAAHPLGRGRLTAALDVSAPEHRIAVAVGRPRRARTAGFAHVFEWTDAESSRAGRTERAAQPRARVAHEALTVRFRARLAGPARRAMLSRILQAKAGLTLRAFEARPTASHRPFGMASGDRQVVEFAPAPARCFLDGRFAGMHARIGECGVCECLCSRAPTRPALAADREIAVIAFEQARRTRRGPFAIRLGERRAHG